MKFFADKTFGLDLSFRPLDVGERKQVSILGFLFRSNQFFIHVQLDRRAVRHNVYVFLGCFVIIPVTDDMHLRLGTPHGFQSVERFFWQTYRIDLSTCTRDFGWASSTVGPIGKNPVCSANVIGLSTHLVPPLFHLCHRELFRVDLVGISF